MVFFVFVFFCFRQIFGFWYLLGYLGLSRDPIFPAKQNKNKKKHSQKARQGHIKHVCKKSGSISQKRRGRLHFCAIKCKNHGLASKLLGFSVYSIFGVYYDLILVLRSQFFEYLRETLYKTYLGAPGSGSFTKKKIDSVPLSQKAREGKKMSKTHADQSIGHAKQLG